MKYCLIGLLSVVVFVFSCKKEISCEGCKKNNKPPIAVAGPDQVITLPTDSVSLDGSASNDPDGTISEWLWKKISGPAAFNVTKPNDSLTVVKALTTGTYQFELKVTDNSGLSANDTLMITVNTTPTNHPPVANAGPDQSISLPTNTVNLDGSNSTDPDNNISSYQWTKISGPVTFNIANANAVQTQLTNLGEGIYQIELKVTDNGNLFTRDTMQVVVSNTSPLNHPPVASAGPNQTITLPTNTTTLDGSASTDPENNITGYQWTKISGPSPFNIVNANVVQTQLTNLVEGIYQFELKVTDAAGLFAEDTVHVIVISQPVPCTACKIVFVSDRDGNNEIYSCHVDGSNIQRLTYDAGSDDEPKWSPDGSRIAFISNRNGGSDLYIMNADGSNVVRKTFSGSDNQNPTWSPDGTKIAYSSSSNSVVAKIRVVDVTSGSTALLLGTSGWDMQPAWSPDGTKIAFVSDWMFYETVYDIYTMSADGTGFTVLTGYLFEPDYLFPSWSPGGALLAINVSRRISIDQYDTRVGIMNSDGSGITEIISGAATWTRTSWSGDGTRIVYTSLSGSRKDVSWVSASGSTWGTIVTDGWNADWQH